MNLTRNRKLLAPRHLMGYHLSKIFRKQLASKVCATRRAVKSRSCLESCGLHAQLAGEHFLFCSYLCFDNSLEVED